MQNLFKKTWFFLGLLAVVILGAGWPALGQALKPWINTGVFISMLLIGFRLDARELLDALTNVKAVVLCLCCGFVLMPLLSIVLARIFFAPGSELFIGVVLAGAVPTTQASSVIWTDISRGNRSLAVVLMCASNLLGVFVSPLLISLFLGAQIELSAGGMIVTLLEFVLLPMLLGQMVRRRWRRVGEPVQRASRVVNIVIIWATVLTALSSSDLRLGLLAAAGACVVLHYLAIAALSYLAALRIGLGHADAAAVMFCSSQATITVAAVIGFSYFAPGSILYVVLYHLFQQAMGQLTAQVFQAARRC